MVGSITVRVRIPNKVLQNRAMKVIMEAELSALVSVLKNPNLFIAIYSIQFTMHLAFLPIKFFYVQKMDVTFTF